MKQSIILLLALMMAGCTVLTLQTETETFIWRSTKRVEVEYVEREGHTEFRIKTDPSGEHEVLKGMIELQKGLVMP
jgi:hypothetical protein